MTPHVLCAPDKFRDGVDAAGAARAMSAGAAAAGWTATAHPTADGGEGTTEVIRSTRDATLRTIAGVDALGRPQPSRFLLLPDGTAVVVAADAIGLAGVPPDERNPFLASSRGLAAPVLGAVAAGAAHVIVFVGGTANMDGGIGFLAGLGADIQDADGAPLAGTGADLDAVRSLDLTAAYRSLQGVRLTLATDVSSPLSGPGGAAEVFGPQKGATPDGVRRLDRGLRALTRLLGPAAEQPGAGAAGGLGAALMALGAEQTSGADYVLRLTDFRQRLRGVDLCVTAEGSVDRSTAVGKAVSAVLRACQSVGVPCAVLGGMIDPDADELYAQGAAGLFAIGRRPRPLADALSATADDLARTTRAVCSLAAVGR